MTHALVLYEKGTVNCASALRLARKSDCMSTYVHNYIIELRETEIEKAESFASNETRGTLTWTVAGDSPGSFRSFDRLCSPWGLVSRDVRVWRPGSHKIPKR